MLLSLGMLLVATDDAAAERAPERISLQYSAAAECPDREELVRRISAYTTRWTLEEPNDAARRFVVRIDRRDERYLGRLELRETSGDAASRAIEDDDCEDVVLALAIAVAIAIDPHAALGPAAPDPAEGDAPRDESATPEPRAPRREEPKARAEHPPRPGSGDAGQVPRLVGAIGARGEMNTAVSGVIAVVDLYVETEWSSPIARLPWVRPVLRAGFRKSLPRTSRVGETEASIDWSAVQIEACPSRFRLSSQMSAEGCLGSNVGVLSAEARDVPGANTTHRPWFDYGAVAAARWQVHRGLFVDAAAAVWLPLIRDRLRIEPDGVVTHAPGVGFSAGIGGGWRF